MAAFPYASLRCANLLVSDCVVGTRVGMVAEGHPHVRQTWAYEAELPFHTRLWEVGDVETATE
eukprot:5799672-Prorocentrum_lima.AAC.1